MKKRMKEIEKDILKNNIELRDSMLKDTEKNHEDFKKELLAIISTLYVSLKIVDFDEMQKYNRYNKLSKQINKLSKTTYKEDKDILVKGLTAQIENTYLKKNYKFDIWAGVRAGDNFIDKNIIKKILDNPISGMTIVDRADVKARIVNEKIMQVLTQGFSRGASFQDMAADLVKRADIDTRSAMQVVRTEGRRCTSQAKVEAMDRAEENGFIFKRRWSATLDTRTRDQHQRLDGEYADKEGYFYFDGYSTRHIAGWGVAEMDVRCRCDIIEEIEGFEPSKKFDRLIEGTRDFITYDDWLNL